MVRPVERDPMDGKLNDTTLVTLTASGQGATEGNRIESLEIVEALTFIRDVRTVSLFQGIRSITSLFIQCTSL